MILYITNAYPSIEYPDKGIFNFEQIESVKKYLCDVPVDIIALNGGLISYFFVFFKILFLSKSKYRIVHFHHGLTYILYRLLFTRKRVFCSIQNELQYEFLKKSKFKSLVLIWLLRFIAFLKKDIFLFKGKPENIGSNSYSFPNGVDLGFFKRVSKRLSKENQGLDGNTKYLLFASSKNINRSQKRMDLFMKLFEDEEINMKYSPLIASNLNREDLRDYINSAEIVVVPSDYEGSSNLIKESIACSAQLVITKVGDYYNYEGLAGISCCEKNNYFDLVDSVKKHNFISYNGHEVLYRLNLSQDQVAESLINIYGLQIN